MSLWIKTYKLVGREYLRRLLNEGNDDCQCDCCTHCNYIKEIRAELFKKGYQTFNKSVDCWTIHKKCGKLTVEPELDDWWFTISLKFFLVQNPVATKLEKADMMLLSKEMRNKDRSMKTQLLIRNSDGDDKLSGKKVWKNNGFF